MKLFLIVLDLVIMQIILLYFMNGLICNDIKETPADNGRFGAMAALAPQKVQCELGSYYPA